MAPFSSDRRLLLSALLVPFDGLVRAAPAIAQSGATLPPIVQPSEKTKAGFLARARALRDQAVKEGDQAYGASSCAKASSSAKAETTSFYRAIPRLTRSCSQSVMRPAG